MDFPKKVRWMQDILPEAHRYHAFLKKVFRHELRKNGFKRITTPILESKSLFTSAVWAWTDVVDKEMYNLIDKKWRELVLKPESTAPIMRAYIENNLFDDPQPVFLYYVEPHFRYDRPQKWRYRQFFQVWAEIIWESDPILDAQLIYIWYTTLNKIGLKWDFKIRLNSIWNQKDRQKYLEELTSFYENKKHLLSEDALRKLETNPLRLLDTKIEDEIILANEAPKISKFLKKESKEHYTKVKEYLDLLGVPYEEDHKLVRGLDYYNHTVWEFSDDSWRSQDAFGWGWRYDLLSKKIGHNEEIPAVWFAFWMERLAEAIIDKWVKLKNKDKIDLYFIQLWEEAKKAVLPLTLEAREAWINTMASLWTPSLKAQMKKANRLEARYVVMVWVMEVNSWIYQVRDMVAWTQEEVKKENLISYMAEKIWKENLNFYCPAKDFILE